MSLSKNSVAIITGAGSGIGRALAVRLSEEGVAGLVISDVNEAGLGETADLAGASGVPVLTSVVDVSRREEVERLADETVEKFGRATHLINNAGVGLIGRCEQISIEDIEWLMGINFWGTVYGTKTFLPLLRSLKAPEAGHIVNISSVFGFIAPPGQTAYSASKFAVRGFTEALRHELEGTGIFVSCVHPGGIRTDIARRARKGENAPEEDKETAPVIFDRLARTEPAEAADVIVRGIKAKKARILIGSDARQISLIQRLFPTRYFTLMDRISGGMLSKFR
ncbi:MAG: SDR family NAD(P)-dependent oxidoreductase [Pyrinomonadaceae bacterium]